VSGFTVFGKEPALATPAQVSATEDVIGTRLPESLKAMLQDRRNGVRLQANQLEQHPSVGVDRFLTADPTGPASIAERWKELRDSVPAWFIPIADCAGSNLLGMDSRGRIFFFWDHERSYTPDDVSLVADDLADLEQQARPIVVDLNDDDRSQGWVNPAYAEALKRYPKRFSTSRSWAPLRSTRAGEPVMAVKWRAAVSF
jgi:hypothetical protein